MSLDKWRREERKWSRTIEKFRGLPRGTRAEELGFMQATRLTASHKSTSFSCSDKLLALKVPLALKVLQWNPEAVWGISQPKSWSSCNDRIVCCIGDDVSVWRPLP